MSSDYKHLVRARSPSRLHVTRHAGTSTGRTGGWRCARGTLAGRLRHWRGVPAYSAAVTDPKPIAQTAGIVLSALRRTRQVRQFTTEPVSDEDIRAILEVARWSGSSSNSQPWTFIVIRDRGVRARLAELAPNARHVAGAAVAIAIAMRGDNPEGDAYDDGRAAERILIAATALGLGAGIGWVIEPVRPQVAELLGVTPPAFVRTLISVGHPTDAARQPKSAPGAARRPLDDLVREL
jgi:nitroreductase